MQQLLKQLLDAGSRGCPVAYTALVETRGSTPQKAGAAMLVFPDGSQAGTLGGGCVEAEVKRRALESLGGSGGAELLTFQLDHDYGWDDGLICGGRMLMLVDPLRPGEDWSYFRQLAELLDSDRGGTEAIVIDAEKTGCAPGARVLFDREMEPYATRGSADHQTIAAQLIPLSQRPRPYIAGGVSYLPHLQRCRLIIVGGGHVGCEVAELAAQVDFDVWVIDDREEYCNAGRFPSAQRLICGPLDDILPELEVTEDTFCIIVTRGHNHDELALHHLAERGGRFVGMIGSKRKIRLIFDDLRQAGVSPSALERVHAPIGLDIGSQTVPEIAVSIVAQLIQHRNHPPTPETSLTAAEASLE